MGELVAKAVECGVIPGLENHGGLGRTAEGVLRIVEAIDSPWPKVTFDTGNFLEDPYPQLEAIAPHAMLVQGIQRGFGRADMLPDLVRALVRRLYADGWLGDRDPADQTSPGTTNGAR